MKVEKKEKQLKEIDVVIESYHLCDKCNNKIKSSNFDAFEFKFSLTTGDHYPEGGNGDRHEMELCESCAIELVAHLKEIGYRIADSEWDW